MLNSTIGEYLGSRTHTHTAILKGVCFYLTFRQTLVLRPYLCTEMMSFRVSVNIKYEGFVKGFRLRCSPQKTDFIWVRGLTSCIFIFYSAVDNNLGLEAQYYRRFGQGCFKSKLKSGRLLIGLWFNMLIFIINANMRPRATWEVVRIQVVSSRLLLVQKYGEKV